MSATQQRNRAKIAQSVHGRLRRFINWSNSMWVRGDPNVSEFRPAHYDQRDDVGVFAGLCICGSLRIVYGPHGAHCRRCGRRQ